MKRYSWLIVAVLTAVSMGCSLPKFTLFPESGPLQEVVLEGSGEEKILVLSVSGTISDKPKEQLLRSRPSLVQSVLAQLKRAERDPQIKAVLMKVNSPGGTVTASDILYHEISAYKARTGIKLVVAMMNVAASGGYYISLPADWIMAHPTTITGSIGVIFARPGVSGFMEKLGLAMNVSKSGAQKDMGSPFRSSNAADEAVFQELTDQMAGRFHDLVGKHRTITPEQMQRIATARVFLADDAQQIGLVDQVGYLNDAVDKAKSLAGLSQDAKVVIYRRHSSEDDNIYNPAGHHTPGGAMGANPSILAILAAAQEAGFYYMWPAALGQ